MKRRMILFLILFPLISVGCAVPNFYYKDSAGGFYGYGRTISAIGNMPGTGEVFINGINTEKVRPGDVWTFEPRTAITVITVRAMTVAGPRLSREVVVNNYQDYNNQKYNTSVYLDHNIFDDELVADPPSLK